MSIRELLAKAKKRKETHSKKYIIDLISKTREILFDDLLTIFNVQKIVKIIVVLI
jgi:hypothetical protein